MNAAKVRELAEVLSRNLHQKTRDDGSKYVSLKDDAPDWCKDVIADVPFSNALIERAADTISDTDTDDDPEGDYCFQDAITEMEADIYYSDLIAWFKDDPDSVTYCDDALTEWGAELAKQGIMAIFQYGQHEQMEQASFALLRELESLSESIEE